MTQKLVQKYSKDKFGKLSENIEAGRLRKEKETQHPRLKRQSKEFLLEKGVILRRERILILEQHRGSVFAAGHEVHPGREAMSQQLRRSVWWPDMAHNMKYYAESCLEYLAALGTNKVMPMVERPTPEGVWRECSVDFKGPIGGKYYLHML